MSSRGIGPDTRDASIERLATRTFDVCVIGGGITGAGIALELAARGCTVGVVEADDFASGASSRSSKLVHGGLRYLARGDVRLCREAARARQDLLRDAPHLVRPIRFLYPIRDGGRARATLRAGLAAYDLLGRVPPALRHDTLTPGEAHALAPVLRAAGLRGGCTFVDAVTDDTRLVLAVLEQAARRGAAVANRVRVVGFETGGGRLRAADAIERTTGAPLRIRARAFVNATGRCAADVARLSGVDGPPIRPSKGVHLVVPAARLPISCAVVFPGRDGRELFAVPRGSVMLVGTTDTEHDDRSSPVVEPRDVEYLLEGARDAFDVGIGIDDVVGAFAGLRSLLSDAAPRSADLSRRHLVDVADSGLVTVAGGKLTTFRRMALDAAMALGVRARRCRAGLGAPGDAEAERTLAAAERVGMGTSVARRALSVAGDRACELIELIGDDPSLAEPLVPGLAPLAVETLWSVRAQMALTVSDVLDRRLGLAIVDREAGLASRALALLAHELGPDRIERQILAYAEAVRRERGPVPLAIALRTVAGVRRGAA